jgi:hypothetical protein
VKKVSRKSAKASEIVKVALVEYEKGWGNRVDEVKTFSSLTKANAFIKKFNAYNNQPTVPDWFMVASLMSITDKNGVTTDF